MYIYYGYESMVAGQPYTLKISRPNGSNCYYFPDTMVNTEGELEIKLPKSHVPILVPGTFNTRTMGEGPMKFSNVEEFSEQLKDILNYLISPPGSTDRLIHQITFEKDFYGAVYMDGRPVTISERQLNIVLSKLPAYLGKEIIFDDDYVRINESCLLYDEPVVITLPVSDFNRESDLSSELHLEYLAHIAFIKLATFNQWLKPYAHRVFYKKVGSSGSIMLPVWGDGDIEMAYDLIDTPLPEPVDTDIDVVVLLDDKHYPLPESLRTGYRLPTDSSTITFNNVTWDTAQVLPSKIPDVDWRLANMAKVIDFAPYGYVPFKDIYPQHLFSADSALKRMKIYEDEAGVVATLEPNGFILGSYPKGNKVLVTNVYNYLWQQGYLLTNYGHYMYVDDLVPLDEVGIRKMNLTLDELRVLEGKIKNV